jgi:tetratricopeptide (TPR) repeat protein
MYKKSLILYFLLVCYISFGQSNLIENDKKYIDSIRKNFDINPDKALELSFDRIKLLNPDVPSLQLERAYSKVGEILSNQGLDKEALKYYHLSHDIFRLRTDNKKDKMSGAPWNFINIGNIYFKLREFDLAKESYYEAVYNFNLLDNQTEKSFGLATSFDNLGLIELNLKNYEKAKDFYQVAYENRIKNKKAQDIIYSLSALSQIDFLQDNTPDAIDKLDRAKKNIFKL